MADDKVAAALAEARRDIASTRDAEHCPGWVASMTTRGTCGDLLAAVEAVLALHPADKDEDYPREQPLCPACSEWWPCDTIRAVSRALLGEGRPDSGDSDIRAGSLHRRDGRRTHLGVSGSGRGRDER